MILDVAVRVHSETREGDRNVPADWAVVDRNIEEDAGLDHGVRAATLFALNLVLVDSQHTPSDSQVAD